MTHKRNYARLSAALIVTGILLAGLFVLSMLVGTPKPAKAFQPLCVFEVYEEEGGGYICPSPSPTPVVEEQVSPTPTPVSEQQVSPGTGSITGFVYVDNNNNGVKDNGDQGLSGVTVKLTGNTETAMSEGALVAAAVSQSTMSSASGAYSFTGLSAGTYSVSELQPSCSDGSTNVGSLGGTAAANQVNSITVGSGSAGVNYNFGERAPCIVSFANTGSTLPMVALGFGLLLIAGGLRLHPAFRQYR